MSQRTFYVANFGCRANQADGAGVQEELKGNGASEASSACEADVVVVNSCTVTEEADRDVRRLIRRVARRNPTARIIVTGCYAQRRPDEVAGLPQVSYVVGNSHKSMVSALALQGIAGELAPSGRGEILCSSIFPERDLGAPGYWGSGGRTRATVKVQDGCNASCSFCVIPQVRGRSRSLPFEAVIRQVEDLKARGYKEIVFSGIHLGSYGRDLTPKTALVDLIHAVVDSSPPERLRLSSIEPLEVTAGLIELVGSDRRLAPHFHLPLQSGSARILRAMRRPYGPGRYADLVQRIRSSIPSASIGADVMVGFPGETDGDFADTYRLVEASPLTYLHVFPYSPRPGTAAAAMPRRIPERVARWRGGLLRQLIRRKHEQFRRRMLGGELQVLVLGDGPADGARDAISDNFIRVRVPIGLEPNRWVRVRIDGLTDDGLQASSITTADETR